MCGMNLNVERVCMGGKWHQAIDNGKENAQEYMLNDSEEIRMPKLETTMCE